MWRRLRRKHATHRVLGSWKGPLATGDPPSKIILPSRAPLSRMRLVSRRVSIPSNPGTLFSFSHDPRLEDAFQWLQCSGSVRGEGGWCR